MTQNTQPGGAGGQDGSGADCGGGFHPGGTGHPGGALNCGCVTEPLLCRPKYLSGLELTIKFHRPTMACYRPPRRLGAEGQNVDQARSTMDTDLPALFAVYTTPGDRVHGK